MTTVRKIPYHFPNSNTVPTALQAVKKLMTKLNKNSKIAFHKNSFEVILNSVMIRFPAADGFFNFITGNILR